MSLVNHDGGGGGPASGSPGQGPPDWFGAEEAGRGDDGGGYAGLVVNRPIEQVLTYAVPRRLKGALGPGQRVRVPLGRGNRPTIAYCVRLDAEPPEGLSRSRLKEVMEVVDPAPLIDAPMLALTRWLADYYACSWGQALEAVLPAGVKNRAGTRIGTFLVVPEEAREAIRERRLADKLPAKQAAALDVLCGTDGPLTVADVCRLAGCAVGPIMALRREGLVHTVRRRLDAMPPRADPGGDPPGRRGASPPPDLDAPAGPAEGPPIEAPRARPTLTPEQAAAMAKMEEALGGGVFAPISVHGVTGSGKTEVYLSAIERVVARGREAIVLVPEISLTPQTIRRFRRRFDRVAVLHSHLGDVERHRHWQSIAAGEVEVVVGARSAIFAPARRLGLIVIDEEHEATFKQETVPRYHARDVAVKRAQLERVPILLGSATPSLESWNNARRGRYALIGMPSRVEGRPMPSVEVIDLRNEKSPAGGLSDPLRMAMTAALEDGGQVILLLNRRGFHTFVVCPRCGHVVKCRSCDVAVTYHRSRHLLLCHTCDAERSCPSACPACSAAGLHYGGIGTERLEKEIQTSFSAYASRRMDSDTMRRPGSHEEVLSAFRSGEVRILLGTQMIAKGLDFPDVTLVGVVNADTALHLPDFRAAERTFQLVAQVAGRTGRGARPGRVLVQTFSPDHPAIRHAAGHDYEGFVASELPLREAYGVPPYGRLVRVIARGPEESAVEAYLGKLSEGLRERADPSVRILGPAPAPILKIRDLYRFHLQLRGPSVGPLREALRHLASAPAPGNGVELAVDVDPVSLL